MDGFRAAVMAKLNGDAALTNMLATTTSIYHRRAPLGAAFPYIIYNKQSGLSVWSFKGNPVANQMWLFKGVDNSESAAKAEDIDKRIGVVLTDPIMALSDGTLLFMKRETDVSYDEGSDPDYIIQHVGGIYRTLIDKT
jgi:hypothetical protein